MKTLRQKLAAQQAPPADGSARHELKPGEVYLWYMGAQAALELLEPDCPVGACRAVREEIIAKLDELVMSVARGAFKGG